MTNDEKRCTGTHHHTEENRDNPVQYSKYYWLKVYLFLCVAMVTLYFVISSLFN